MSRWSVLGVASGRVPSNGAVYWGERRGVRPVTREVYSRERQLDKSPANHVSLRATTGIKIFAGKFYR